jgi:hypothetical protein
MGKQAVVALTERNGDSRSFRVAKVTGATLRPIMVSHVSRKSALMTDQGGLKDGERAALIAKGIEGKRLTYRPTH